MKIKFLGAIERVTGSCSLLEEPSSDLRFLVDCGMVQGDTSALALNSAPWPFVASRVDFVLLTHAHLDHCGLLPRLVREGFSGQIYCTRFTAELARLNLLSAAAMPGCLFTRLDVEKLHFEHIDERLGFSFEKPVQIAKGLFASFQPTAHIGGACAITIRWLTSDSIWKEMSFSGDLGPNTEFHAAQPLLAGRRPLAGSPSYMLVESTYGGRVRDEGFADISNRMDEWAKIIRSALASSNSTIVAPCFSIHRCQEILLDLHAVLERHLRDEIVMARPWIDEDFHRRRVLESGIKANHIERRINVMHEWPENRRADFYRIFARCDDTDGGGRARRVYRPVSSDSATIAEALELVRDMRVFDRKHRIQVILDSPLAQKVTGVYRRELKRRKTGSPDSPKYRNPALRELFCLETEDQVDALTDSIFLSKPHDESEFSAYTLTFCRPDESEEVMKNADLNIVLSSSGMGDVGPIVPHLVRELPRCEATIVLTGYAGPETIGGKLRASSQSGSVANGEPLQFGDETIAVANIRAKTADLGSFYSGHADSDGLLDFVFRRTGNITPLRASCRVFINHGDDNKRQALIDLIKNRSENLVDGDCLIDGIEMPMRTSKWFDLDIGEWIPDEAATARDDTQSLLLRLVSEQQRTNDLLAELLRLQRLQKPVYKAK